MIVDKEAEIYSHQQPAVKYKWRVYFVLFDYRLYEGPEPLVVYYTHCVCRDTAFCVINQ